MSLTETLAAWAVRLEPGEVPERVVQFVKSQLLSELAAARATLEHELGPKLISAFGVPFSCGIETPTPPVSADPYTHNIDPKQTAYILSILTMALDFDETFYAGHVSHSSVGVSLAYAYKHGLNGYSLLGAIITANECAARVVAAASLGHFRGQTAAFCHLVSGVAARLKCEGITDTTIWTNAWGIALSMPPWTLYRGFLGSDAKMLTAAVPIRTALDACDAALGGFLGAVDILEHPDGFLAQFCDVPLGESLTAGLGERWHTETMSVKVYPGCAYIDSAVDAAISLHFKLAALNRTGALAENEPGFSNVFEEITEVTVKASVFTWGMHLRSAPYINGQNTPYSALQFSLAYNVATALITGALTPSDLESPAICDPLRWELAAKVRVELDLDLTYKALLATAPIGEALRQAGSRANDWINKIAAGIGGGDSPSELKDRLSDTTLQPSKTFETATKEIGAEVVLKFSSGKVLTSRCETPKGAIGPETRKTHLEMARSKFFSVGGSAAVADLIQNLEHLNTKELAEVINKALK